MELPQELEVWYVIPTIRGELAKAMKELGLKQTEIADKLELTKAAVSQYLSNSRGKKMKFEAKIKKEIKISAEDIMSGKKSAHEEIQRLCGVVKKEKVLCKLHKEKNKEICDCEVCLK